MIPIDDLLLRLQKHRKVSKGWTACCPAHDDKNPSLSVSLGDAGRILLYCHAGCTTEAVVAALGLPMRDLMLDGKSASRSVERRPKRSYASEAEAEAAVVRSSGAGSLSTWASAFSRDGPLLSPSAGLAAAAAVTLGGLGLAGCARTRSS